jgi:hypothetical protein
MRRRSIPWMTPSGLVTAVWPTRIEAPSPPSAAAAAASWTSSPGEHVRGNDDCPLALHNLLPEVYENEWDMVMVDAPKGYFEVHELDAGVVEDPDAS